MFPLLLVTVFAVSPSFPSCYRSLSSHAFLHRHHWWCAVHFGRPTSLILATASEGFGAEFAREYAKRGRSLVLVARSQDKLEALKEELKGVDVKLVQADLSKPGAAEEVYKQCEDLTVSTLVCNAGQAMGGAWEGHSLDRLRLLINLNISAVVELSSLFMPKLKAWAKENGRQNNEGGLLNVSRCAPCHVRESGSAQTRPARQRSSPYRSCT